MSGIPLSEERFIELFKQNIKTYLDPIITRLDHLQHFQDLESKAIEYELRQVLLKYLQKIYPIMTVEPVRMKELKDPISGVLITDLDGAFSIGVQAPKFDMYRMKQEGIPYIAKPDMVDIRPEIFVLAEAKHYIHRGKIAYKLAQFDKIVEFFRAANDLSVHKTSSVYTAKFAKLIERDKSVTNFKAFLLFFCASFWDGGLMEALEQDVETRRKLVREFFTTDRDSRKIDIYRKIRNLEMQWYSHRDYPGQMPPDYELTDNQILELKEIRGAMENVQFILPSGDRYRVYEESNIMPVATLPVGGKRKQTRKQHKASSTKTPT